MLADVALPLLHDAIAPWEVVQPDLLQRMLLAGVAVDSPADATSLHPALFSSVHQAESAFARQAFPRHFPIRDLYREMTVKSAVYRRPGRGRSRQTAYWIEGDADDARARIQEAVGELAEWRPQRTMAQEA